MKKKDLKKEFDFCKEQIQIFKERISQLEGGLNRERGSSNFDFDVSVLWSAYRKASNELELLILKYGQ